MAKLPLPADGSSQLSPAELPVGRSDEHVQESVSVILNAIAKGSKPDSYTMLERLIEAGVYQIRGEGGFSSRRAALVSAQNDLTMALATIGEARRQSGQSDIAVAIIDSRYHHVIGTVMSKIDESKSASDISILVDKFLKLNQDALQLAGVKVDGEKIVINNQTQINQNNNVVMPGGAYREFQQSNPHNGGVQDLGALESIDAEHRVIE